MSNKQLFVVCVTITSATVRQSTLTVTSTVRFGSNAVVAGHVQLGSLIQFPVVEQLSLGSSLSMRSFARLGSCVSVSNVPKQDVRLLLWTSSWVVAFP